MRRCAGAASGPGPSGMISTASSLSTSVSYSGSVVRKKHCRRSRSDLRH
jgi:hypothetical protein